MGHAQLSTYGGVALAVLAISCGAPAAAASCVAESDARTAALVELYTGKDCAACPPAEEWIASLQAREGVLPFVLHVDAVGYLSTRERVEQRTRKLTLRQRMALVYTPQVLIQGRPFRGADRAGMEAALAQVRARPARARLALEIVAAGPPGMLVRGEARLEGAPGDAVLYMAAFERQARRRLIREWQGPFGLSVERALPLLPGARPESSGAAAFVQDRRTGEVLQAIVRAAC